MGLDPTDGRGGGALALGKGADALVAQFADANELLDILVAASEGVVDDDAEELLKGLPALLDHLGVLVGLFPKMRARKFGQLQLHIRFLTFSSCSS